jgi:hypothetical protein
MIALESGCKFNAGYYVSKVPTQLSEWLCEGGGGNYPNLTFGSDNTRPHTAALSQQFMARKAMAGAAHSPYSPHLAPSNFHLFAHVKGRIMGESIETGALIIGARGDFAVPRNVDFG